ASDDGADVTIDQVVGLGSLLDDRAKLLARDGNLQPDRLGGRIKAIEVCLALEDSPVVDADAFEDAVAVEQPVVVNADFRFGLIDKLSVEPDLQCHLFSLGGATDRF